MNGKTLWKIPTTSRKFLHKYSVKVSDLYDYFLLNYSQKAKSKIIETVIASLIPFFEFFPHNVKLKKYILKTPTKQKLLPKSTS